MRRVAIPISGSVLSEYFGGCNFYEVYEITEGIVSRKRFELPEKANLEELPDWLESQGITDVIANRVSPGIIARFAAKKVNLFVGIEVKSPEQLIDDYRSGKLESSENIIRELTSEL